MAKGNLAIQQEGEASRQAQRGCQGVQVDRFTVKF